MNRLLLFVLLILDAAIIDPFRMTTAYRKNRLAMTWADFWNLT